MIRIVSSIFILCSFCSAYSQDYLVDKIARQAVQIDSLQRALKTEKDSSLKLKLNYDLNSKKLLDSISDLNSNLSKLQKIGAEKKSLETQIKQKSDSIDQLIKLDSVKTQQISLEKQRHELKVLAAIDSGKNEVLSIVVNSYKNKKFDDLIDSSAKMTLQRDKKLVSSNTELKQVLSDLEVYWGSEEVLEKRMDAALIKSTQKDLKQIKQQSALLVKQKEKIDNYQSVYDGLKETIGKIIELDSREEVSSLSKEIQKQKFNKILSLISSYIFDYGFNFIDYPYLSDIVLEVIKRKQPKPDADITDLLKKL